MKANKGAYDQAHIDYRKSEADMEQKFSAWQIAILAHEAYETPARAQDRDNKKNVYQESYRIYITNKVAAEVAKKKYEAAENRYDAYSEYAEAAAAYDKAKAAYDAAKAKCAIAQTDECWVELKAVE